MTGLPEPTMSASPHLAENGRVQWVRWAKGSSKPIDTLEDESGLSDAPLRSGDHQLIQLERERHLGG